MTLAPGINEIWQHTKTGNRYKIVGLVFNSITDEVDVVYAPLYPCEYAYFSRQMLDHPKAFLSENENGSPRFQRHMNGQPHRSSS